MMTGLTKRLILPLFVLLFGCAGPRVAVDPQIDALLAQLNTSSIGNRMARMKLVKMGTRVVPAVVSRLDTTAQTF